MYQKNEAFSDSDYADYEKNTGLIATVAKKVYARASAMRLPMDFNDVYNEMCCVYLNAVKNFDPNSGSRFSTYFTRAAYNKANANFRKIEDDASIVAVSYEDAAGGSSDLKHHDSILELITTGANPSADYDLIMDESFNTMFCKLSKEAKYAIMLYLNPTDEIITEFEKMQAKAEHSRFSGESRRFKNELDIPFILDVLKRANNLDKNFTKRVWAEIKNSAIFLYK